MSGRPAVVGLLPVFFYIIQISHGFEPSETFDRNLFLDTTVSNTVGQYRLYWKVVGDEIKFEAHVATLGWIGLGFSPTGGMTGADIMVGGVRNGKPYIYDRHATGTVMPVMDAKQDYQAMYGVENATHTVLKFKRKLNTCDRDDWTISNDTVNMIWAYNPADAMGENEFNMHERRGTRRVMLLEPSKPYQTTECGSSVTSSVDKTSSASLKPSRDDPVFIGSAGAQYTRHLIMDPNGNYHLFWRYDDTTVTFEVQAKAQGWVGLGISPAGGMTGADIIHAFIDKNGLPQLTDRYALAPGLPQEDPHQDYNLIKGSKNDTHIIVVFSRQKFTCDDRDLPLTNDTMKLIWAMSDVVPVDKNNFQMHQPTSRGTKNVRLFEKQVVELPLPSDVKTFDVVVTNVSIPGDYHTLYWCQLFELPQWPKHHMIRFDPIIQKGNEMVVHHILLYECKTDMSQFMSKSGEPCFDRTGTNFSPLMLCSTSYIAGWAIGGESKIYPSDVGFPMFGSGASKHIMMEMHYDNSNYLKGKVDSSGFRFYVTPTLRPIESGVMGLGVDVKSEDMMIPAGQPEFTFYTYCYSECSSWIPPEGFTVMSGIPHTHLAGRKVRIHHIRNGVQLPDLFNDENYDFNYQASIIKSTPVKILPGDEFIVECVYNTSDRNETTYGGFSTHQEMCIMYIDYYPRPKTGEFDCLSFPYYGSQDFKKLFNGNYDEEHRVYILPNGTNITAKQFAETMVKFPNQSFIQQYQNVIKNGEQIVLCTKGAKNNSSEANWEMLWRQGPVQITKPLVPEKHCRNDAPGSNNNQNNGSTGGSTVPINPVVGSGIETYSNHLVLDSSGKYHLFWRYDDTTVTFEVQARAQGWVGLGISPAGGMTGADIVHAFIDKNGSPQLTDRYAPAPGMPQEDPHQDYNLIKGSKNDTHITVVFSRKKFTCDDRDLPLTDDTLKLIWAMSDVVPVDKNNFQMHQPTSRGTKNVRLFEKQVVPLPLPSDVKTYDVLLNNVSIPDDYHTLYWCQLFELPQWPKHHMIRFDPVIQKGNEMVVHHILLYECKTDMSQFMSKGGEPCFDRTGTKNSPLMGCTSSYIAGWAIGAESKIYPSDVGFPMFGPGYSKYMMMQMHYDNSNYLKGKVDSSGFRFYLTQTLRPIESGVMGLGVPVGSEYTMLPAGQPEFTLYTYCYSECTNWIPTEGLTIMSGIPHTHLAGRKVRIQQIRNGVQLPYLFNDENFDFNYQASIVKSTPVKILRGDEFIVECVYSTSDRKETTYGGFSTHQEMCEMFIDYYPRPKTGTFVCMSFPSYGGDDFKKLFSGNYNVEHDVFILPNGTNITANQFFETMVKFPNQSFIQQYQNVIKNGEQGVFCNKDPNNPQDTLAFVLKPGPVQIKTPFVSEKHCLNEAPNSTTLTGSTVTTRALVATTKSASSLKAYGTVVFVISLLHLIHFLKGLNLFNY